MKSVWEDALTISDVVRSPGVGAIGVEKPLLWVIPGRNYQYDVRIRLSWARLTISGFSLVALTYML